MGSRELFGIACASSLTINCWHFKVLMFINKNYADRIGFFKPYVGGL